MKYICHSTRKSGVHFVISTGAPGTSLFQWEQAPHMAISPPSAKVHSHKKKKLFKICSSSFSL